MASPSESLTLDGRMVLAVLATAFAASRADAGGFAGYTDPVRWAAGSQPSDVQTADLNGDQRADMVTADESTGMLSVMLGLGDGTFLSPVSRPTIVSPKAVALADFNGDHRPDAAVVSASGNQLAIHLNLGDGTFGEPTLINLGAPADSVVAGDFNGDGHADLFVGQIYAFSVTLVSGDGTGAMQVAQTFTTPYYPWCIEAADVNGDGVDDLGIGLLSGGQYNAIRMLLSDGQGGILAPVDTPITRQPVDLAFGDFNRDQVLDCVTIDRHAGAATMLSGSGDGAFFDARFSALDGQPEEVEAVDVNNDGVDDVVAAHSYFHRITTIVGLGDGTFLLPVWQDVGTVTDLAHADFDGNGFQDVVVGHSFQGADTVSVLINRSAPGVAAELLDVQAANGFIVFGPVEDIRFPDNVSLRSQSFAPISVRSAEQIDLRVTARTNVAQPRSLNLSVISQANREHVFEHVRLRNRQTGQFDVVMIHTTYPGDGLHSVSGVDAAPYVDADGMIEMSIRFASAPRHNDYRLEGYVDWVDIAVE